MAGRPRTIEQVFWSKFQRGAEDECWRWGACTKNGYGNTHRGYAHRMSWEIHNGPVPSGMFVCHRCDNKLCVNPSHLFLGSPKDNNSDMWAKGRGANGERNGHCKISDQDVRDIRANYALCRVTLS